MWSNTSPDGTAWPRSPEVGRQPGGNAGFTLIETIVGMLVLMIGMLGLATVLSFSLMVSNSGRAVTNSKLLLVSVLEQMETLRNTRQLTFGQVANTGGVDNTGAAQDFNGFPTTFQPVSRNPGPDGIFGTSDDLLDAGADGNYGTSDDFTNPSLALNGFTRQITITNFPSGTLKRIEVTLKFPGANGPQTRQAVSYLNDNARSNFTP